ncbi:hypothetical protein LNX45_13650, partial [Klebsiella pneumoniae]|nr:hypothetical protein [Klebsiella pneumoniae]
TPSVAEQEGQQTETEATGAPQKHHYTLNQQVGSITDHHLKIIETGDSGVGEHTHRANSQFIMTRTELYHAGQ